ncbi:MAG: transcription termination factor NusA [Firmicutes bacterium]|nr:transcription termination factor NusA [Bacillota bacterium]MCL1954203.1 transcription termination factor NusA [Bacillota bacterium]
MINKDFFLALDELENIKGIKKETFIEALEVALENAYKRHTNIQKAVKVRLLEKSHTIKVIAYQTVVEYVEDRETQISLEDARLENKKYKVGDIVSEEVASRDFGRIAAQTAKQIVLQKLREVESAKAIEDLVQYEDSLQFVTVRRIEGSVVYVEINKIEAQLSPNDLMPNDKIKVGDRIKVYVKKIKSNNKGPQVLLSRTAAGYVKKLFEQEVPELLNGVVQIKNIVRDAGYRTKVAVFTEAKDIDPVGAFVGNRGMRVNSIVSDLGGEKVDIIPWCEDILEFIARSLSPAKVAVVQVDDSDNTAKVAVQDDQLSLAIGKNGQNARLAARLTGWKIDVKTYAAFQNMQTVAAERESELANQELIDGIDEEFGLEDLEPINGIPDLEY